MSRKVYLIKAFSGYRINLKSVAQNVELRPLQFRGINFIKVYSTV